MTAPLFEIEVASVDFGIAFRMNCIERTLDEQRFDVGSGSVDSGGFLLSGNFRCSAV